MGHVDVSNYHTYIEFPEALFPVEASREDFKEKWAPSFFEWAVKDFHGAVIIPSITECPLTDAEKSQLRSAAGLACLGVIATTLDDAEKQLKKFQSLEEAMDQLAHKVNFSFKEVYEEEKARLAADKLAAEGLVPIDATIEASSFDNISNQGDLPSNVSNEPSACIQSMRRLSTEKVRKVYPVVEKDDSTVGSGSEEDKGA